MFKTVFLVSLIAISIIFVMAWIFIERKIRKAGRNPDGSPLEKIAPPPIQLLIGFIANFFDTLGIGSFAICTSMFKLWRLVPDEQIPGTLNVGNALPTIAEACIFLSIVQVDLKTLLIMIGMAVLGSWIGAGIVSRWPRRTIQISMGFSLLAVATLMSLRQLKVIDSLGSGNSIGLEGYLLWIGAIGNFILGALMTIGIGLYAPCMALVYMLGMYPKAAYPIMSGSCAFLMPVGSLQFIRSRRYNLRASLGIALGGLPGVFLAAYVVKSLPIEYVIWLVVAVVVYTATRMLHSAQVEKKSAAGK